MKKIWFNFFYVYDMEYKYLGDRLTDFSLKGKECNAVRNNGKCVRGRNGNMLVKFNSGKMVVVTARLLRKIKNCLFV